MSFLSKVKQKYKSSVSASNDLDNYADKDDYLDESFDPASGGSPYRTTLEVENPNPEEDDLEVGIDIDFDYRGPSKGSRDKMGVPLEPDDPEEYEIIDVTFSESFEFNGKKYKDGDEVTDDFLKLADSSMTRAKWENKWYDEIQNQ